MSVLVQAVNTLMQLAVFVSLLFFVLMAVLDLLKRGIRARQSVSARPVDRVKRQTPEVK